MLPLWARARETEKDKPVVFDPWARDLVGRIDYDFSQIEEGHAADHQGVWALRSYNFDVITRAFLEQNSHAVVIRTKTQLRPIIDTTLRARKGFDGRTKLPEDRDEHIAKL